MTTHYRTGARRGDGSSAVPLCSRCDGPRDSAGRYCKACHAAYQKEWRSDKQFVSREKYEKIIAVNLPPAFVYLIAEKGTEFCKVGVADDIEARIATLQIGNPRPLFVANCWSLASRSEAFSLESLVLKAFAGESAIGEWVKASPKRVAQFVDNVIRSENMKEAA
jgi:hypothetical protein